MPQLHVQSTTSTTDYRRCPLLDREGLDDSLHCSDETVTEEHDRLQRRTHELCDATKALPLSLTTAEHEAIAAALREHHSATSGAHGKINARASSSAVVIAPFFLTNSDGAELISGTAHFRRTDCLRSERCCVGGTASCRRSALVRLRSATMAAFTAAPASARGSSTNTLYRADSSTHSALARSCGFIESSGLPLPLL